MRRSKAPVLRKNTRRTLTKPQSRMSRLRPCSPLTKRKFKIRRSSCKSITTSCTNRNHHSTLLANLSALWIAASSLLSSRLWLWLKSRRRLETRRQMNRMMLEMSRSGRRLAPCRPCLPQSPSATSSLKTTSPCAYRRCRSNRMLSKR